MGRCFAGCINPAAGRSRVCDMNEHSSAGLPSGGTERWLSMGEPLGSATRARTSKVVQVGVTQTGERRALGVPEGLAKGPGQKAAEWGALGLGSWAVGAQRPLGRSLIPFHVCACLRVTLFPYAVFFSPLK